MAIYNILTEHGYLGAFTRDQAPGAIANGTHIVKTRTEEGDANPIGATGVVLGSLCHEEKYLYFVEWDSLPRVAVGVSDWKIERAPL
jgi:hypothetical protein